MRPDVGERVPCKVHGCPLPGALMHADEVYCVPDYRAHPATILRPLSAPPTAAVWTA